MSRLRSEGRVTPSEALRHVCRRCGRHFLLCEAEGCRTPVMPAADAAADAETLWLLVNAAGPFHAQQAQRSARDFGRMAVGGASDFARERGEMAARAAFRAVPGLRE